jgi:hypothetical protein
MGAILDVVEVLKTPGGLIGLAVVAAGAYYYFKWLKAD